MEVVVVIEVVAVAVVVVVIEVVVVGSVGGRRLPYVNLLKLLFTSVAVSSTCDPRGLLTV